MKIAETSSNSGLSDDFTVAKVSLGKTCYGQERLASLVLGVNQTRRRKIECITKPKSNRTHQVIMPQTHSTATAAAHVMQLRS